MEREKERTAERWRSEESAEEREVKETDWGAEGKETENERKGDVENWKKVQKTESKMWGRKWGKRESYKSGKEVCKRKLHAKKQKEVQKNRTEIQEKTRKQKTTGKESVIEKRAGDAEQEKEVQRKKGVQ